MWNLSVLFGVISLQQGLLLLFSQTQVANAQFSTRPIAVDTNVDGEWFEFDAHLVEHALAPDTNLSKYGGWKEKSRRKATGYFRVEKVGDRWWAVDPDGYLFLHKAVNSVNLDDLSSAQIHRLLHDHGFNGIGNWSDEQVVRADSVRQTEAPLTYTPKFSFIAEYRRTRSPRIEMPVFDDAFVEFCKKEASYFAKYKDDPNVFGYFSDNELSWTANGLATHLAIKDPSDKNYAAAVRFLVGRGKSPNNYNNNDIDDYTEEMAQAYFSAVGPAIKAVDPNHMYLGTRLNKSWDRTEGFMRVAGKYLDCVAINHYHRWNTKAVEIDNIVQWTGKPVIVTEFYAMQMGNSDTGAGFRVQNQFGRGRFFHNYVSKMIQGKNTVGWHWFKYQDDEQGNKGILSPTGNTYDVLLDHIEDFNKVIYQYTDYIDSLPDPDLTIVAEADAYFQASSNYGSDKELKVKEANDKFRRQAYLRFDVSAVTKNPKSALIQLFSISTTISEAGHFQAELVNDNSWDEDKIVASNSPGGSTVLAKWSQGDDVEIDVTDFVDASTNKLSIRIVATENNGAVPTYGSREHPKALARPKLLVYL